MDPEFHMHHIRDLIVRKLHLNQLLKHELDQFHCSDNSAESMYSKYCASPELVDTGSQFWRFQTRQHA